jgi:hypothetical protein
MIKNSNKKLLYLALFMAFFSTLNAQEIDTLSQNDFPDKSQDAPFATVGLIYALSAHSFVRLNGKFAAQQNVGNAILRSKSDDLIKQSTIKTLQIGAFVEYFVIF